MNVKDYYVVIRRRRRKGRSNVRQTRLKNRVIVWLPQSFHSAIKARRDSSSLRCHRTDEETNFRLINFDYYFRYYHVIQSLPSSRLPEERASGESRARGFWKRAPAIPIRFSSHMSIRNDVILKKIRAQKRSANFTVERSLPSANRRRRVRMHVLVRANAVCVYTRVHAYTEMYMYT